MNCGKESKAAAADPTNFTSHAALLYSYNVVGGWKVESSLFARARPASAASWHWLAARRLRELELTGPSFFHVPVLHTVWIIDLILATQQAVFYANRVPCRRRGALAWLHRACCISGCRSCLHLLPTVIRLTRQRPKESWTTRLVNETFGRLSERCTLLATLRINRNRKGLGTVLLDARRASVAKVSFEKSICND